MENHILAIVAPSIWRYCKDNLMKVGAMDVACSTIPSGQVVEMDLGALSALAAGSEAAKMPFTQTYYLLAKKLETIKTLYRMLPYMPDKKIIISL